MEVPLSTLKHRTSADGELNVVSLLVVLDTATFHVGFVAFETTSDRIEVVSGEDHIVASEVVDC